MEKVIHNSCLLQPTELNFALQQQAEVAIPAYLQIIRQQASDMINKKQIVFVSIRHHYLIFTQKEKGWQWGYKLSHSIQLDVEPHPCPIRNNHKSQITIIDKIKLVFASNKEYIQLFRIKEQNLKKLYFVFCDKAVYFSEIKKDFQGMKKEQNSSNYRIFSKSTQELFYMKALSRASLSEKEMAVNFHQELQVLMKGKHENVTKFERVYRSNNSVYLIYQFWQYRLNNFLVIFGFPDYEGKKIILKSLLNGIAFLHKQNIIHGNISLQNIYLTFTPDKKHFSVKVGDFQRRTQKCSKSEDIKQISQIYLQLLYEKFFFANPENIDLAQAFEKNPMMLQEQIQSASDMIHKLLQESHLETEALLEHPYMKSTPNLWPVNYLQIKE